MKRLQLYSLATPNGQKVSIALEEMGLEYDAHKVDITKGAQFDPEFIKINPNSKIPALVDREGDHGRPLHIMESGAILIHLADLSGKFLSTDPAQRNRTLQWLFFQVGSVGPMFGQFGHFYKYAKGDHPYSLERYSKETKRLLKVIDDQLEKEEFLSGNEMTIADIATAPWVDALTEFYKADEQLELESFTNVKSWLGKFLDRPAVQKGQKVCAF